MAGTWSSDAAIGCRSFRCTASTRSEARDWCIATRKTSGSSSRFNPRNSRQRERDLARLPSAGVEARGVSEVDYPVVLEKDDNETILVSFPDFPEVHTFGTDV